MADNKKKKTDFSSGLKAAAEKLAPRDLRKDVLTIDISGVPTPIARGDMSDEAWSNIVKQSVKEATPGEYKQPFSDKGVDALPAKVTMDGEAAKLSEEDAPDSDPQGEEVEDVKKSIDWPRLMSLGQNLDQIDKSLVSDEEKGHLKGMSEWSRAEFLRERMRKHGYEVPKTTAEAEKDSFKKEATVEGTPKAPPQKQQSKQSPGTQTEDTVSSAGPGMSPLANAQAMMMGAAPENIVTSSLSEVGNDALNKVAPMEGGFPGASSPAPMEGGFPGLAGGDAGVAQANAKGEQHGAEDLATLRSISDAVNPMNLARKFDNAVTGAMKPLNDVFTKPSMSADEMDAQEALARRDPGVEYDPAFDSQNFDPNKPNVPQNAVMTPSDGPNVLQNASLRASLSGGGGFTPAQVDPAAIALQQQAQAEATQAQRDAQARIQAESENQRNITAEATKIELDARQKADVLGALAVESQMEAVKHAESWSAARMSAAQAARDAAANPIDPNRYWNSKTDGQRAMSVMAGAIYGFLGQGMNWLQRIDGLVDSDNRLQASDRASKVEGLKGYAAEMGAQADDAMKFGLSRAQAQLLQRTQKLEGLKSQLDILTMRQTDAARAQQGAMMSAQLGQHIEQIASQGLSLAQQTAQMKSADRYHNAQLAMERLGLQVKAAAKKDDLDKLDPQALARMEAIDKALAAAQKARDAVKDTGWSDSLAQTIVAPLNAMGMTGLANAMAPKSSQKTSVASSNQETVIKGIMGEALQEADIARNKPRFAMPGIGSKNTSWLDESEDVLRRERNAIIENAKRANRDVGSLGITPTKIQFTPSAGK